ncbi:glutathione S-transferase family protein [Dyella mobilis]|uniref:Glutathione S-transferase family protein n=1 Tax=Dyella mobilis TaxID=1849582 RepID=A0ABS2KDT9_9GAMM|nr:glutathione S-transferase family protein [Dyella mobilis]MBM7129317.1 glutathione S-transferase family protein [Dyella mobilis]GLQ98611.1 glutathione S-transferase [Dyella mobilis]
MYTLYVANHNYSSWSLRPWVLLTQLGIPFEEKLTPFGHGTSSSWTAFRAFSPTGKVPCLHDGDIAVWDSLSIAEYLAERHPGVWPTDARARAWARSAAAEMHSGFDALRSHCPMNCGIRMQLGTMPAALMRDLTRLQELWNEGLTLFGGPYLAGAAFTTVDAFFAPVAFRIQSYQLPVDEACRTYAQQLLGLPAMKHWYETALQESWRDPDHEEETLRQGTLLQDLRARLA